MDSEALHLLKEQLHNMYLPKYKRNQFMALERYLSGESTASIAAELNLHPRSIQRYIRNYRDKGLETLQIVPKPGNKNKLRKNQENKIRQDLQKEPSMYGYLFPEWTPKLIKEYIKNVYGVSLSQETCRKLFHAAGLKKEKLSVIKQRKLFEEQMLFYQNEPDTEVWALSDIYLGIRERRKNKKGKLPYYPDDLLKDENTLPKIDLTQKAKEEWVLCLKAMKSQSFFYWRHTDQQDELPRYTEVIQKIFHHTDSSRIILIMADSATNRRNFLKKSMKESKSIVIKFIPPHSPDLNPLNYLKEDLTKTFSLKKKRTQERKILPERKVTQILKYLHEISHHET